jgi:hypothetical protein
MIFKDNFIMIAIKNSNSYHPKKEPNFIDCFLLWDFSTFKNMNVLLKQNRNYKKCLQTILKDFHV